jgi:hypothetical protein
MALRTETRGALTESLRRKRRNLIQSPFDWNVRTQTNGTKMQKPPQDKLAGGFFGRSPAL